MGLPVQGPRWQTSQATWPHRAGPHCPPACGPASGATSGRNPTWPCEGLGCSCKALSCGVILDGRALEAFFHIALGDQDSAGRVGLPALLPKHFPGAEPGQHCQLQPIESRLGIPCLRWASMSTALFSVNMEGSELLLLLWLRGSQGRLESRM